MYDGGPQFYLLMSVFAKNTMRLYASYEDVFNEVQTHEFIGMGDTFARYLATSLFKSDMITCFPLQKRTSPLVENEMTLL